MAHIEIRDECLAPEKFIYLTYKGPDPWGIFVKITDAIRPFFHVSASGTSNTRVNWDLSGDPATFFSTWWVKKEMSRFTRMIIWIKIQGKKKKAVNEGEFTLQLNSELRTRFDTTLLGPFLKPIWLIYSYLFYNKIRRQFIDRCMEFTRGFRNEIKDHFNLEVTTIGPAKTAMA